jgi:hypothetical protein
MSTLPPIKRFTQDDYNGIKDISAFCSKLFYPLNLFLNAVYTSLNNGLTLSQNTIGSVTTQTTITSDSTGKATTTINWTYLQSPPQGIAILACLSASVPQTIPLYSWSYNSGVITISMQFVKVSSGAIVQASSATYSVTFWATGG